MHQFVKNYRYRGIGTGDAGGAIAPTILLEIGKISAFTTLNVSRSEERAAQKKSLTPSTIYTFSPLSNKCTCCASITGLGFENLIQTIADGLSGLKRGY